MDTRSVIGESNLYAFFRPYVQRALGALCPDTGEEIEFYLVRLLAEHARSQHLFQGMGKEAPAIALQLTTALRTAGAQRVETLKRVGDYTLYMTGFFSGALDGRAVDVRYYKSLGIAAYHHLASHEIPGEVRLGPVFGDLAERFERFVDVLEDVSERSRPPTDREVLRLYAQWWEEGCAHSAERLTRLGYPLPPRAVVS